MVRVVGMDVSAVDLFCGAGGTSTGLAWACEELGLKLDLTAVDHWPTAVKTHALNHSRSSHFCEAVDRLDPRKVVPSGRLTILVASPECTNHSVARGGRPINDQSRATAWHILKWAQELHIEHILIENVLEFRDWGPLGADGRPLKSKKGQVYQAFLDALRKLGYRVEDRALNAADFGDATTRKRLFIQARRPAHKPITWPEPSHTKNPQALDMYADMSPWVPAREIIDWTLEGESIFTRKRPLAKATLERIKAGLWKFCRKEAKPLLVPIYGEREWGRIHGVDRPDPTITGADVFAPVDQHIVKFYGDPKTQHQSVREPLHTVTAKDRFGLVELGATRYGLDIRFRMLQPHELAAAMGFPNGYKFAGNRVERVKQIGNAVAVRTARALLRAILDRRKER
jgi:DNA (cytosine-5)-methyltransferase 1